MQRCMKRIDEFANRGYEVEAYGFDRGVDIKSRPQSCAIHVIGKIDTSLNYIRRTGTIYKGIREVLKKTKKENTLYYIFGFDNAVLFRLQSNRKYIYEESDLVHTYMGSKLIVRILELIDRNIIKKSFLTVFTSEGFLKYHFGNINQTNTVVVPNRLPMKIMEYNKLSRKNVLNKTHLAIGFVGFIRYKAVFNFARVFCETCPDLEFHFWGTTNIESDRLLFEPLLKYKNCIFHGPFKYPDDLPSIYASLDMVVATYDTELENVKYAEPNKIYESIFFETPIIVSTGTFLADKVNKLGIGFDINALNDEEVVRFVKEMTFQKIQERIDKASAIDKRSTLNINDELFEKLVNLLD